MGNAGLYRPIEVIRFAVMEYVRSANGRLYEPFDVKAVYMVDASGFYALGRMSCVVWVLR